MVDVRDRERSAWSDVPKRSGFDGRFSHHHRQMRSQGGADSPENLILLLGSGTTSEHGWVHANPQFATVLGFIVHGWDDPLEVPVFRLDAFGMSHGWFLRTAEGQLVRTSPLSDSYAPELIGAAVDEYSRLMAETRLTAIAHL